MGSEGVGGLSELQETVSPVATLGKVGPWAFGAARTGLVVHRVVLCSRQLPADCALRQPLMAEPSPEGRAVLPHPVRALIPDPVSWAGTWAPGVARFNAWSLGGSGGDRSCPPPPPHCELLASSFPL